MTLHRFRAVHASAIRLAALLATVSSARGDQLTLTPVKDNTIYAESSTLSNGAGTGLFAGASGPNNNGALRRALLAFDVAAAIPAGSTITSVQLVLQVTMSAAGSQTMSVHRVLADWGEGTSNASSQGGQGATATTGDATWRFRFFNTQAWKTRGGDFVATASATQDVPGSGAVVWGSTDQLVADVQGWLDGTDSNFGWIILGNEDHQQTAKRFASRESSPTTRPMLVIELEPAVGQATATSTPTATPTQTVTPTQIVTPTQTVNVAPSATASQTSTAVPTVTAQSTQTTTASAEPTNTAMPTVTAEPTQASTPSASTTSSTTAVPATPTASATMVEPPTPTETLVPATVTPTAITVKGSATPTDTAVPATASPTGASPCLGDCDHSGMVSINELITGVNIALGSLPLTACPAFDPSGDGTVEINELIIAVNNALSGCG